MRASEAAEYVLAALSGGDPVAEVVVITSTVSTARVGSRMLVWEAGRRGTLGAAELDRLVEGKAREVLGERSPTQVTVDMADGGAVTVFIEPHYPPDELVIVGAGHIARPLCHIGALLGFRVVVLDDRPGFATRERFPEADRLLKADFSDPFREIRLGAGTHLILVTRGHKYDYDALKDVLQKDVKLAYIGMVGSQRRVRAALEQLVREGIPPSSLSRVYAPIGLDIMAETPEEIAVSIAAELIRVRRGGTGMSIREKARVVERWIRE